MRISALPPSDAVRQQKKNILEDLFSSVLSQFEKKYHSSENLIFNHLGIFQSLKSRILARKILPISLTLNFITNILGCYGLTIQPRRWDYRYTPKLGYAKLGYVYCASLHSEVPSAALRFRSSLQRKMETQLLGNWTFQINNDCDPKQLQLRFTAN